MSYAPHFARPAVRRSMVAFLAALLAGAAVVPAARADLIEKELLRRTTALKKYLKAHKAKTIGVLKFRGSLDGSPPSFSLGPINSIMATRVETVLILGNEGKEPFDVIHEASTKAAGAGLSYATEDGRRKLFDQKYPLVMTDAPATPDLFLTGVVSLDTKTQQTTVEIVAFSRDALDLDPVAQFTVRTERSALADAGRGFVLQRSALIRKEKTPDNDESEEDRKKREEEARANAEAERKRLDDAANQIVRENEEKARPQESSTKPVAVETPERMVDLEIYYNNERVSLLQDEKDKTNRSFNSRDPKKGDSVYFLIKNKSKERVAVVLQVNGKNTILQECWGDAAACTKWVIDGEKTLKVEGFYIKEDGTKNVREFQVLSEDESEKVFLQEQKGDLGDNRLGTISMSVFVESNVLPGSEAGLKITRGLSPARYQEEAKKLTDYNKLRALLFEAQAKAVGRGLIATEGAVKDGSALVREEFKNPQLKENMVIRYYMPPPK